VTALAAESQRVRIGALLALLAGVALGCAGSAALPAGSLLEKERTRAVRLPDEIDQATRHLLGVALVGSQEQALRARDEVARLEDKENSNTGLLPYADHLVAAMGDDAIDYRTASLALLERDDLEKPLREFLEAQVEDDPLRLAKIRIADSRKQRSARIFNKFASAAGRSISNLTFAPARLASAALSVAISEHNADPISLPERQALHHWKRYVDTHPGSPETPQIVERIESAQLRWFAMKRKRSLRAARKGLEHDQNEVAFLLADRALRYSAEDSAAQSLLEQARRRLELKQTRRSRSLQAPATLPASQVGPQARLLALALFNTEGDLLAASEAVLASNETALYPEAHFSHAIALSASGQEVASWEEIQEVARSDEGIGRHAAGLLEQPVAYPYGAFRNAIATETKERVGQVMLGHLAHGPRDLGLPRPLEWMIDGPSFIGTLGGIPQRLLQTAISPPPSRLPAVHGYRYLRRRPEGEHADEVRDWLIDHERSRKNFVGAYQLARADPDESESALEKLEERAAKQALESAERQERSDLKLHYLNEVSMRFPDTEAGHEAGQLARKQIHSAATQRIRISRGFLEENPHAAGPEGLGLRPELLDGERHNGELHPDGVTLIGGRDLEIALLARSGDKDDEPETRRERLSEDRLGRLVALLDETAIENALLDPLAGFEPDADRDLYFERARLGVADTRDTRATALSNYAFVGVREKYSMVRTHEPLLPFDIVIQGSFPDLGFGAFPRLRGPRLTPDAILYR
jgi:hypothetical protein